MNRLIRLASVALLLILVSSLSWSADQGQINQAVAKGAKFLQSYCSSPNYTGGQHGVGSAALAGLALLEANVPLTDPSLQNIIRIVRNAAPTESKTYNIALSIVFLDRLGQREDALAIQILGIRLYSGLTSSGGWSYNCGPELGGFGGGGVMPGNMPGNVPGAIGGGGPGGVPPGFIPPGQAGPSAIGEGAGAGGAGPLLPGGPGAPGMPIGPKGMPNPPGGVRPGMPQQPDNGFPQPGGKKGPANQPDNGFPKAPTPKDNPNNNGTGEDIATGRLLPQAAQYYAQVRAMMRGGRQGGDGDNSNTQFGLIALWIAARHGVPAQDAFALIEARFITTQHRNGGWGYTSGDTHATPSMTCAGLLGLAVAAARNTPAPTAPKSDTGKKGSDDPFDNPKPKKGGDVPDGRGSLLDARRKTAVDAALNGLSQVMRVAAGRVAANNANNGVGPGVAPGAGSLQQFVGLGNEYYLLWSIERVCMAYGLDTLGDIDWHSWGADILIPMQSQDGSWPDSGHYGPDVNTAFAILFLTRSNFVRDLSARIRGSVRDPGKSELRGSNVPTLFAPKTDNSGKGGQPAAPTVDAEQEALTKGVVTTLLESTGPAWTARLNAVKLGKGSHYTMGMVIVIPQLDPTRKKEAREALAERLTRMTASTLRKMMNDANPELRRGAVLACGMKEDLDHVVDLIERITDSSDLVVRATRASLKSLTNQDFGPPTGASDEAKDQAKEAWTKWLKEQQNKP